MAHEYQAQVEKTRYIKALEELIIEIDEIDIKTKWSVEPPEWWEEMQFTQVELMQKLKKLESV